MARTALTRLVDRICGRRPLLAELASLRDQQEQLTAERGELLARCEQLTAERDGSAAARDALDAERAELQARCDALAADRDRLAAAGEARASGRAELQARCEDLTAKRAELLARCNDLAAARDRLAATRDGLGAARDRLAEQRDRLSESVDRLTARCEALVDGRDELVAQRTEAVAAKDRAIAQRDTMAESRDRLTTQCRQLTESRDHLAGQREDLREIRDRLTAQRDAMVLERDRAIDQRDQATAYRDELLRERDRVAYSDVLKSKSDERDLLEEICEGFDSWQGRWLYHGNRPVIVDNIYGYATPVRGEMEREGAKAVLTGTWMRLRAVVYALTKALQLKPILPLNDVQPALRGIGLSDDVSYGSVLARHVSYTNTFYHKEPALDVLGEPGDAYRDLDFIISSDVFEHLTPPAQRAFENCHAMLKPGGALILTVPYVTCTAETLEHFPNLHDWRIIERAGEEGPSYVLENETADGQAETFEDLVFHGGAGQTIEMRLYALADLLKIAADTGFDVDIVDEDVPIFGIFNGPNPRSVPMILRKK